MIDRILDLVSETDKKAHVKALFGEPQTVGERTIIPVAEVRYGYGVGHGRGSPACCGPADGQATSQSQPQPAGVEGQGGGVRLVARPVAVIEITRGGMKIVPVVDSMRMILSGMALGAWALLLTYCMVRRLSR